MNSDRKWTDEQDTTLRGLLAKGISFTNAAAMINSDFATSYSRNAAIGRAHRLGIKTERKAVPGAGRKPTGRKPRPPKPAFAKQVVAREPEMVVEPAPYIGSLSLPFGDLRMHAPDRINQCRFPEGDAPAFHYCGTDTAVGSSWCAHHAKIVYEPKESRKFRATASHRGVGATNFSGSFVAA